MMISDDTTPDNFTRYMINRVERAIAAIEALVKAALPRMRKGGRIILLTNSLWTFAVTKASNRGYHALVVKHQALGHRAQEVCPNSHHLCLHPSANLNLQVLNEYGIELSFLINRIVDDSSPLNWETLRDTVNSYASNGYNVEMLRKIGARVGAVAAVGMNHRDTEEEALIYDKALMALLHAPQHWGFDEYRDADPLSNLLVINTCFTDRYNANLPGDPPLPPVSWRFAPPQSYAPANPSTHHGGPPQPQHRDESVQQEHDLVITWIRQKVNHEVPLDGKVALVLDSGRSDGVTQEVCLELARLGAKVALAYDGGGESGSRARQVIEKVVLAGGQAIGVCGLPYRSVAYTDKQGDHDYYIGDMVTQALKSFGAGKFHVIGMYLLHTTLTPASRQSSWFCFGGLF